MDSGKPAPGNSDVFTLASEPTPESVEMALRWWVDHPAAPQGFVNTAIWQRDPALLDRSWEPTPDGGRPAIPLPKGRAVRSHGGTLYFLDDGALTSVDPEGIRRFHGTGVFQVFPSAEGLFAAGSAGAGRELWRFATTGDPPWMRLFDLPTDAVHGVWNVPGGAYVWGTREGVYQRASRDAPASLVMSAQGLLDVSVVALDPTHGRFAVVAHEKGTPKPGSVSTANVQASSPSFTVYDLDGRTGRRTERRRLDNARSVAGGPAGLFVVTLAGRLERLHGDRLQRASARKDVARIVCVGRSRLVVGLEDGTWAALALSSGVATPIPGLGEEVPAPGGTEPSNLSIDPVTDDLVWMAGGVAQRWAPDAEAPEVVRDANR